MTGRLFLILGAAFLAACSDYIVPEGEISGGSKIYYKGRPSILNVENSGGSQIVACD